ncbi:MAG: hypothetical protein JXR91_13730 [Deltaproteobacteria bacterium]|nr:hypothetical protein [Deltaproteobacteria bacterium]
MTAATEAYEAKLETINAIKDEDVKAPVMPMDTYFQEARDLYHWATKDKEHLFKAGISPELFRRSPRTH